MTQTAESTPAGDPALPELITDPVESAKAAGLRYVSDQKPGIRREPVGDGFRYVSPKGEVIEDPKDLARIKALAIPPAWTGVWISPSPKGHIQATGRDAKRRKQYRYHPRWRAVRDETKYGRMLAFGAALPQIRARVDADLARRGLPREKVLATIVRLLEKTAIRIGNEEYARENRSYGLTTMRNEHVDIDGSTIEFHFRGKSGKMHKIDLQDLRLARIVKRLQDLEGQELFQYVDEARETQTVDSADVNEYLRAISGQDFTAKDFRTWAGTVLAALELEGTEAADSQTQAKKNVVWAIENVAAKLGNTPSVCRKCYVHPAVIESYLDGSLLDSLKQQVEQEVAVASKSDLNADERRVLRLLQQRLEAATESLPQAS